MTHGPRTSSPSATAAAKAAMASIVVRRARANASSPRVASSPERWGSSEVWTAWKSWSGARVMSSALKTTPARIAPDVPRTVSTAALRSVCSASWMPATASAKPAPPAGTGRGAALELGLRGAGRPRSRPRGARAPPARRAGRRAGRPGSRAPPRSARRPARRHGDREAEARDRLEEDEPAVEPEPAVPGDVAAGEVARGVGERRARRRSSTARACRRGPRAGGAGRARRRRRRARSRPATRAGRAGGATSAPWARRRAIVRESSCSTGR